MGIVTKIIAGIKTIARLKKACYRVSIKEGFWRFVLFDFRIKRIGGEYGEKRKFSNGDDYYMKYTVEKFEIVDEILERDLDKLLSMLQKKYA